MSTLRTLPDPRSGEAGFTLIEMLIATMLMVFILTSLATVTAQWLPNWNYGMARMERDERFAFGLNRMVEDLAICWSDLSKTRFWSAAGSGRASPRS